MNLQAVFLAVLGLVSATAGASIGHEEMALSRSKRAPIFGILDKIFNGNRRRNNRRGGYRKKQYSYNKPTYSYSPSNSYHTPDYSYNSYQAPSYTTPSPFQNFIPAEYTRYNPNEFDYNKEFEKYLPDWSKQPYNVPINADPYAAYANAFD